VKVKVTRQGGLAGLTKAFVVDSVELSPEDQRTLNAKLSNAGFFESRAAADSKSAGSTQTDRFIYLCSVERDGVVEQAVWREEDLPLSARALLTWLESKAKTAGERDIS